ncbi:MAG: PD40 domain-containing protein [Fimbriimonadaceae bacterium]|nr:PD40 domain-containing protein [Fimbriimonadaceae bacterium]
MQRLGYGSLLVLALTVVASAQDGAMKGARSLALSPDGSQLAFTYQGDVWVAPASGGKARPITTHVEMDDNPIWSPDGKRIAFASNRTGNWDVFIANLDGGRTQRLTYHSGSDVPSDWTPDGKAVVVSGTRDKVENGVYSIEVATGRVREWMLDPMSVGSPKIGADGRTVMFNRLGFPSNRERYFGSAAAQIVTQDALSGKRTVVRNNGFQHLWPHFGDAKTLFAVTVDELTPSSTPLGKPKTKFVDNARRTPNVYEIDLSGKAKRVTDYVGGGVRYLTVSRDGTTIAYEYEGDVYTMKRGDKPQRVEVAATIDDRVNYEERIVLTTGAEQASLDAKGETMAFMVRGELWTTPVKKGKGPNKDDAVRLTEWPGIDANPLYHPTANKVFFTSDRDGAEGLYALDLDTKKTTRLTDMDSDVSSFRFTPDQKYLSFFITGEAGGLFRLPVDGGSVEKVFSLPGQYRFGPAAGYAWSPDGRYVAYVNNANGLTTNIHVYDTQTKKDRNVTRLNASHRDPEWSPDGKYLYFVSDREGDALYTIPLKRPTFRDPDYDLKYEKPKDKLVVEIDFDEIEDRIRRFSATVPGGNLRPDPENGDLLFLQGGDIWKVAYNGESPTKLTNGAGIGGFEFNADGKKLVYTQNGAPTLMEHRAPNRPVTTVAFRADWVRDVRAERKAAYYEFWRQYNRSFYDGNFHGRDWAGIRKRYEPLLESVAHRNEMATLLNLVIGEVESSHSEVGPAAGNPSGPSSAHLGFTVDYAHEGPGLKIKSVPKRAPGSYPETRLAAGEYVLAVDGVDVQPDEALYGRALNDKAGRVVTLLVNDKPSKEGAREVKYEALSGGAWRDIDYRNQVEARRKYVEEKSGGKLTYVHIAGMGGGNFDLFNREVWEYGLGKEGVVIDVRWNGGGNISDRLIDILERIPHSYYQNRDGAVTAAPSQSWNKPIVVLQHERSFSNAEMFPYAMKQLRLATTIGMPTPGYVIWTYGLRLVDGTSARMPTAGVYRLDGTPLENMGQVPDIKVDFPVEDYFAGRDPQLDKAIEVLLKARK